MNSMKNLLKLMALVAVVFVVSCKDDDDDVEPCNSFNFGAEIEAELNAFIAAANAYSADPSPANCNAYKAAGLAYVDELEDLKECALLTGQNEQQYQADIDEARASFEAIVC